MGLRIFFSDRVDALAARLCAEIASVRGSAPLPPPIRVVVPNANLAKWLKLTIAETNQVAINLEFPYLEKGLWEMVKAVGGPRWAAVRPLEAPLLQRALCARIARECATKPDSILAKYCLRATPGSGGNGAAFPQDNDAVRRVWQLAGRFARLFREYELHRNLYLAQRDASDKRDMIGRWHAEESALGGQTDDEETTIEKAQRELYQALFRDAEASPLAGHMSLPTLGRAVFADPAKVAERPDKPRLPIHIFGMSQLSPFHCWLLYQLADVAEITLYHFNVCREFWEDVETPREHRWRKIRQTSVLARASADDDEELDVAIENPLLGEWGKAGREAVKLLADLDDGSGKCNVVWLDETGDEEPATVLRAVQHGIARRCADLPEMAQDCSLQIAGCPGVRREVETVYNSILTNMTGRTFAASRGRDAAGDDEPVDPAEDLYRPTGTLKLTDIAVLVPDMQRYKPALLSVFGAEGDIPFNLSDSTADADSVYGKAVVGLLDLAGGRFTRRAVFGILSNPCVLAGVGASVADLEQWLAWADSLGVFHSYDETHRESQGLPATARYTWQQALRRIRLGRIMEPPPPDAPGHEDDAFGLPVHEDMMTGGAVADRFSYVVERLYHQVHGLGQQRQTVEEWISTVERLMDAFVAVPADLAAEDYVRRNVLVALREFAGRGEAPGFGELLAGDGVEQKLSLAWIRQFILDSLVAIPSGVGAYLTGGVTVASLLPMRPVPFKVVYVMGMTEGGFPGRIDESTLDLRRARRLLGDVSRPEAGRYLFLETLMTVKEKLYLTYDNLDPKKDEEKFPCSVIRQLQTFLNAYVMPEGAPFRDVHLPLNSHSAKLLGLETSAHTDLLHQWSFQERALAYALSMPTSPALGKKLAAVKEANIGGGKRRRLAAKALAALAIAEDRDQPPRDDRDTAAEETSLAESITLDVKELAKFLYDPAEAILSRRFGLYDDADEGDAERAEDEPLKGQFLDDFSVLAEALRQTILERNAAAGASRLEQRLRQRDRASMAPEGAFASLAGKRLAEGLAKQSETLIDGLSKIALRPVANVALGNPSSGGENPELTYDAVCLDVRLPAGKTVRVALTGWLPIGLAGDRHLHGTIIASPAGRPSTPRDIGIPHQLLQPVLFFMALIAGDRQTPERTVDFHVCFNNRAKIVSWSGSFAGNSCRTYLKNLIVDYLTCDRLEALPYKLIVAHAELAAGVMNQAIDGQGREAAAAIDLERFKEIIDEEKNQPANQHPAWRLKDMHRLCRDDLVPPDETQAILARRLKPIWQLFHHSLS